jgi:hypothetical protein
LASGDLLNLDTYDGSVLLDADVVVVTGTPGAGAPALPTNCLPLRNVTVPAGASSGTGGLVAGNLSTDRRTYVSGLGGVVPVASQAERDALPALDGTVVYRTDVDRFEGRSNGTWRVFDNPDQPPYFHGKLAGGVLLNAGFSYTYAVVEDSHSGWSTNLYTIPVSGVYRFTIGVKWSGTPTGTLGISISVDGTGSVWRGPDENPNSYGGCTRVHVGRFTAGQVVRVVNATGSYTTQSDDPAEGNALTIEYVRS